jgi:hypothetical protein
MICAAVALAYCLAPVRAPIYMPHPCAILTRLCQCAGPQALVTLVINFPVYIPLYSLIQYIAFFVFCTFNSSLAFLYTRLVPRQTALHHTAPSHLPNVAQTYEADIVGYARSLSPRLLNWPSDKAGQLGHQWHYFVRHWSELG